MTEQEQEHWDFEAGRASEFQNCLTEATSRAGELCLQEADKIAPAVRAGRFVVIETVPYYCKSTDALAGVVPTYRGDFATRAEAEGHAATIQDSEFSVYVLPEEPQPPAPAPVPLDDIPF